MGAVMVGTSEHICSAPVAAYLVRNQSRFKFSTKFKYVPVREVMDVILQKSDPQKTMKMSIMSHVTGCFLINEALHYLHRPKGPFEKVCLVDFFKQFEVVRKNCTIDKNDDISFDIDDPEHPGFEKQIIRN